MVLVLERAPQLLGTPFAISYCLHFYNLRGRRQWRNLTLLLWGLENLNYVGSSTKCWLSKKKQRHLICMALLLRKGILYFLPCGPRIYLVKLMCVWHLYRQVYPPAATHFLKRYAWHNSPICKTFIVATSQLGIWGISKFPATIYQGL